MSLGLNELMMKTRQETNGTTDPNSNTIVHKRTRLIYTGPGHDIFVNGKLVTKVTPV